MKLLIIEDNPDIVANLTMFLGPRNYDIETARNGLTGYAMACEGNFDAIVLDLGLPGLDGMEVCRRLRCELPRSTPILMLTARDTLQDKISGFEIGADDYLVKPFSMLELEVRLKALLRRSATPMKGPLLHFAGLSLDLAAYRATRAGTELRCTPIGYRLLASLLRHAPDLVPRDELLREVWGSKPPDSDALRTHVHTLRAVLDKPFAAAMLQTVPGLGYRLVQPDA